MADKAPQSLKDLVTALTVVAIVAITLIACQAPSQAPSGKLQSIPGQAGIQG